MLLAIQRDAWRLQVRPINAVLLVVAGFIVAIMLDTSVLHWTEHVSRNIETKDWYRLLRVAGYGPSWLIIALAMYLVYGNKTPAQDGGPSGLRRGLFLLSSVAAAAGCAVVLKPVFRRLRPEKAEGLLYVFRPLGERTLDGGGLSLPSEHAAVAFGAVFALWILIPQGRWLWLLIGIGCGMTRILVHAHYVSDVYIAAVLGWIVVHCLTHRILQPSTTPAPHVDTA
jgi:membrane-associated phospholipid phosphatase